MYNLDLESHFADNESDHEEVGWGWWPALKGFYYKVVGKEDDEAPPEDKAATKTTKRQIVIYISFLVTLCAFSVSRASVVDNFYFTDVMRKLFLDTTLKGGCISVSGKEAKATFRTLHKLSEFWEYTNGPLIDALYWGPDLRIKTTVTSGSMDGYLFYANKLVGLPRIRQVRVQERKCDVRMYAEKIEHCYEGYSADDELTTSFGSGIAPMWKYQSASKLSGSSHWGLLNTYGGGGFVQDLRRSVNATRVILNHLHDQSWIDRSTRAVFIDFSVYNANLNIFCVVRLLAEFPPTGGVVTSWIFNTVRLRYRPCFQKYFDFAASVALLMFLVYLIFEEVMEIVRRRYLYLRTVWCIFDSILIVLGLSLVVLRMQCVLTSSSGLAAVVKHSDKYIDIQSVASVLVFFNDMVAFALFFAVLKLFKLLNYSPTMEELLSSVVHCAKDLKGYGLVFIVIFCAFAQVGYLTFGSALEDFRTFGNTLFTLFRIIMGDYPFKLLAQTDSLFGPLFYASYVIVFIGLLTAMFLAIVNETYSEVRLEMTDAKANFGIGEFLKKGYNAIADRLRINGEKMADMELLIEQAKTSKKHQLVHHDWKRDLMLYGIGY